jgi:hypothetical protein
MENQKDSLIYISIPLIVMIYGKKKILTSEYIMDIKSDSNLMQNFGAIQSNNIDNKFEFYFKRFLKAHYDEYLKYNKFENRTNAIIDYIVREINDLKISLCKFIEEASDKGADIILELLKQFIQNTDDISKITYAWRWILDIQINIDEKKEVIKTIIAISNTPSIPFDLLSECANYLNRIHNQITQQENDYYNYARNELINILTSREREANSTDHSRIAWLLLSAGKNNEAKKYAQKGFDLDNNNIFCQKLLSLRIKLT